MWAKNKQTNAPAYRSGFTIVELLIVIVVIGILAAITIVAYNGIQQRARISTVSSALTQAAKKLAVYQVDNTGYPATGSLATAGVTDSQDTTYQYTGSSTGFCLTATNGNVSYKITESTTPTAGGCPGHGQGGVAAITNMSANPSFEANLTGWGNWAGTGGAATLARNTTGGQNGTSFGRLTWSTGTTSPGGGPSASFPVTAGQPYSATIYVRSSKAQSIYMEMKYQAGSTVLTYPNSGTTVIPANTWQRISFTSTAPATATSLILGVYATGNSGGTNWIAGDYMDADSLIVVNSSTQYNYADGNSPDWVWSGTTHNSTSTGPPL
jgi:prepilin-type N-terminal cleavage/methylation domain-containing protein